MNPENKMQPSNDDARPQQHSTACDSMPDFTRLRYFHGQMLGHHDFQSEQDYFREKLKLLNRCLEGYGTVCGLKVVAIRPDEHCDPPQYETHDHEAEQQRPAEQVEQALRRRPPALVEIECGFALDCEGNELVVRHPIRVDLWQELAEVERKQIEYKQEWPARLYLSICFCVQPIDPVRPVLPDACSAVSECVYSKLRDSVKVKVSTEKPTSNHCRSNCCSKCQNKCLLLAAIDFGRGEVPVIHNDVRRWITVYEPVTITGINWHHGAAYSVNEARHMLRREGLMIEFSRSVLTETITDGVIDAWVMEGGSGRSGNVYNLALKLILPTNSDGNALPTTTSVRFKRTSGETLQDGDRVLLIVRTDFILDECCRPVDGNHAGGRVPHIGEHDQRHRLRNGYEVEQTTCLTPPRRYGPWVSGNNSTGGTFESWFYIRDPDSSDESGEGSEEE